MSNSIIIISALIVFALILVLLNKFLGDERAKYKRKSLDLISRDAGFAEETVDFADDSNDWFGNAMSGFPILGGIQAKLIKSGSSLNLVSYLAILVGVAIAATYIVYLTAGKFLIAIPVGIIAMVVFNNVYIGMKLDKRNQQFLNDFPDAIDMIVRSIRSGHPLLASLKLIVDNSRPPLSTEFRRVVDEVSYGRPMSEALRKMADRIGILDVNFFVVILSVQQETGGSMAEVLTNLSNIIRKRKQLNLKIRALTSEGRITVWIFACIPFFQIGAVLLVAPRYLDPLWDTSTGNICFVIASAMITLAIYIARQLCKLDV